MAINSRKKGSRAEREFAAMAREHGFLEARRGQQYNGIDGQDVVGIPGHHIEVKHKERINVYEFFEQACRDVKFGEIPALAIKKNRKPWLVVLPADHALYLIRKAGYGNDTEGTSTQEGGN